MLHVFIKLLFVTAAFKWGDWQHWKKYYSTILFFIIGDLLYSFLFYQYPMWTFHDGPMPLFHYQTFISLSFIFLRYPATVLIYLGRFPKGKLKALFWWGFWVLLYTSLEVFDLFVGMITHHNGWHLGWSILFNIVLFLMVKIHFHRPFLAWILSFVWILFLWNALDVPIDVLK